MAKLRIYNDIVNEEEKVLLRTKFGINGICYNDIQDFINSIPDDDNTIDIRIHCRGGSCVEGWAIYDALRRSDKLISATVEGECSSMATIILLAAPVERRSAFKNIHMCLHNPRAEYIDALPTDPLTADILDQLAENITKQSKMMREEQDRILDLYVERTGANRKALQSLMDKDIYIDAERAQELGFISTILVPTTAIRKSKSINNSTTKTMSKIKTRTSVTLRPSVLDRLLAKAGLKSIDDLKMVAQVITAADGTEFTVEREEGYPQVGDAAYPDGSFVLDDGTTVVVENEVITRIDYPGAATPEPTALSDDPEEIRAQIAALQARLAELDPESTPVTEEQVEALEAQVEQLQQTVEQQAEDLKQRNCLSENEKSILAKVNKAGGISWLDSVINMRSTFTPSNRRFVTQGATPAPAGETKTQKAIREKRAAAEAKRAKRAGL